MIRVRYQLPVTSPGAILREEKRVGSSLGLEADKLTSQGRLVPDEMVNAVVGKWLEHHGIAFVFDGYPRSRGQADALDQMLSARRTPLEVVVFLKVDLATIHDRVASRVTCSHCGLSLSLSLHLPGVESGCPSCGRALTKRQDDKAEALEERMREYAEKTEPLISYYSDRSLLRPVDGNRPPDAVFDSIVKILEQK